VRSIWLGSAGQLEGLERQVEVADDRVVDELDAGAVDLDVGGGPPDTNSGSQAHGRYVEVRSYSQSGEPVGKQLGKQRA
jgi:hypothetical protein